jgi:hypothetical protein
MWEKVCAISKTQISKAFPINYEFTSQILIVSSTSNSANTTWKRAGYLEPTFLVSEIGQVKAKRKSLIKGIQLIEFKGVPLPYFLEYQFLSWFLDIDLNIWVNPKLISTEPTIQLEALQQLAIENRENIALLQQQLDKIEQSMDTTTGQ